MSIDPTGKLPTLRFIWDVAAYDLPVPARMLGNEELMEWKNYVDCLSPTQQMRKLEQALEQFHNLWDKQADPLAADADTQAEMISKWEAARITSGALAQRLRFMTEESHRRGDFFKTDVDQGLYYLTEFMKSVRAADTQKWEDIRAAHNAVDGQALNNLLGRRHGLQYPASKAPRP